MDDMTRFEARFEERLRSFAGTGVQSVDSAAVAHAVAVGHPRRAATRPARRRLLDEIHRTRQRAVFRPWRTRSKFRAALSTAAVVALLVVGGALLSQRDKLDVSAPSPTAQASGSPSDPAVVTATPTPTAEVRSLDLTWTEVDFEKPKRVAWLDDQFVLLDEAGVVSTSSDGATWSRLQPGDPDPGYAELLKGPIVTWEDQIVGWWNPEEQEREIAGQPPITARDILRIVRPPAEPIVSTPFDGRIQSVGLGPVGIVVETEFWPNESTRVDTTWFSPDGVEWTKIQDGLRDAVGVSDGFIARDITDAELCTLPDGCGPAWHSSDGLTWRNLGHPDADPEPLELLVPWKGGALSTDGIGRFVLWTSQGYTEWPMAAEVPAQPQQDAVSVGTGPLGLVALRRDRWEVLLTRDGVDWKIAPLPAAMWSVGDRSGMRVAVGEASVVYLTWSGYFGEGAGPVPSLWVGTVQP